MFLRSSLHFKCNPIISSAPTIVVNNYITVLVRSPSPLVIWPGLSDYKEKVVPVSEFLVVKAQGEGKQTFLKS